ncbi:SGNH/GDSL hydrolase family protein [Acinetobacter soli]|uniref:SGNH/GDSL hydrolase family protein n=1 Tax=Acinetobacter soli TaxID=487316 RepID=UPI001250C53C|nr:SGNH/GDSL hydrolase family protein [Acinetobacter soli]
MTNLTPKSQFDDVYQLERNDPALAGPGGILNKPLQDLTNRTEYLKDNKADKSEIVKGQYSFTTLAKFNEKKATIPANSTVIIDEAGANQGTNTWDGNSLNKSSYDPLAQAKADAKTKADTAEANAKQFTTQYLVNLGLYSGKIPAEYDKNGIVLRYLDNSGNMIVSGDLYANGVKLAGLPKNVSYLSGLYPAQIASDNIMPMSFDKFGRLIAIPHPSFSKQVIEQTKSAVDTSSIVSSTNIVLFGDSITATGSGYGDAFMLEVQADRTVVNRGIGGQDTREIVQRQGGVPIPVAAFTMPASGSVSVTLTNGDCYYQKGGTYAATINDIAIIVAPTSTQNVWTVTRVNAGAATAIPAGSIIILEEQKTFRNHTLILQPGPNWNITTSVFTETQILQTIEYTAAAINYLAPKIKKFLIIGEYVTANYSQDISNYLNTILKYNALLREFSPANFFDIHKYGSTQAIYDAQKLGLISSITSQDLADMAAGYVPNSLTVDGTHPTAAFKTVLAKRIALTLKIRGI